MKTSKILTATILGLLLAVINPIAGMAAFGLSMLGTSTHVGVMFTSFFDPAALTLPVEGVKSIGELIYTDKFVSPKWTEFMDIERGIKAKKQLIILGHFNGLSGAVKTGCDITPNPGQATAVEKTWDPAYVSDRFEECFDNLQASFWKYMLANGLKKEDLTQSDYDTYVTNRISEYMSDDMMYQKIFFTDKNIVSGGTNNLSAGQLKYFNMIDGVFVQLGAIVLANTDRRVTITENAAATYTLQAFATASPTVHPVTDYLNSLIYGASMELRGVADPIILVSQSVCDQYARERKAVTNIDMAYLRTEQGMKYFEIDGVQVMPIYTWDRLIKRHFDNGTKLDNPHRMLYTSKKNIRVGTEEESNFTELSSEYSSYHKKWFCDFGFNLDVKIVDDNLVQYGV